MSSVDAFFNVTMFRGGGGVSSSCRLKSIWQRTRLCSYPMPTLRINEPISGTMSWPVVAIYSSPKFGQFRSRTGWWRYSAGGVRFLVLLFIYWHFQHSFQLELSLLFWLISQVITRLENFVLSGFFSSINWSYSSIHLIGQYFILHSHVSLLNSNDFRMDLEIRFTGLFSVYWSFDLILF